MFDPATHISHRNCLAIAALLLLITLTSCTQPNRQPNVIIITIDTLRADHLGCYGYPRNTSPFIDSLAQEGIVYEQAYTQSTFTGEAISGLFSGLPPLAYPDGQGWWARPNTQGTTLPKAFKEAGYTTGHFANSPVMAMPGFSDHFDEFACLMEQFNVSRIAPKLTKRALEFANTHKDKPYFLYLHYIDPHGPYEPPEENYQRFADTLYEKPLHFHKDILPNVSGLMADGFAPGEPRFEDVLLRYDAELSFVDDSLRKLFEGLDAAGELDNTIVLITSDHGEEFLEHNYFEHAWTLYDEVLRVPLILWAPEHIAPSRISERVNHSDIMPTLFALTEQPQMQHPFGGVPLVAKSDNATQWQGAVEPHPLYAGLYLESRTLLHAVIEDNHKLIQARRWLDPKQCEQYFGIQAPLRNAILQNKVKPLNLAGPIKHELLFDLTADPQEQMNKLSESSDRLEQLRKRLKELIATYTPPEDSVVEDPYTPENVDAFIAQLELDESTSEIDALIGAIGYFDTDTNAEVGETEEPNNPQQDVEEKLQSLGYF